MSLLWYTCKHTCCLRTMLSLCATGGCARAGCGCCSSQQSCPTWCLPRAWLVFPVCLSPFHPFLLTQIDQSTSTCLILNFTSTLAVKPTCQCACLCCDSARCFHFLLFSSAWQVELNCLHLFHFFFFLKREQSRLSLWWNLDWYNLTESTMSLASLKKYNGMKRIAKSSAIDLLVDALLAWFLLQHIVFKLSSAAFCQSYRKPSHTRASLRFTERTSSAIHPALVSLHRSSWLMSDILRGKHKLLERSSRQRHASGC